MCRTRYRAKVVKGRRRLSNLLVPSELVQQEIPSQQDCLTNSTLAQVRYNLKSHRSSRCAAGRGRIRAVITLDAARSGIETRQSSARQPTESKTARPRSPSWRRGDGAVGLWVGASFMTVGDNGLDRKVSCGLPLVMAYGNALAVLADPTRGRVLERLRGGAGARALSARA